MTEVGDIITATINAVNERAATGSGPSLQDLIHDAILEYAEFTNAILDSSSMKDVDEAAVTWPRALRLNDRIQYYLVLAEKGIVDIDPSDRISEHVYHPGVQYLSQARITEMLLDPSVTLDDQDEEATIEYVVRGLACAQLLRMGRIVDPELLSPYTYPLVHYKSRTLH